MYRYNGKEYDEGTGLYDYGARYYDPAIARWGQVDPLADQFAPWSPYSYVYDNPIIHTDPTGMAADWYPEYDEETQKINLVAEKGDNLKTLEEWSNGLFDGQEIKELFGSMDENGRVNIGGTEAVRGFLNGFGAESGGCEFNCRISFESGLSGDDIQSGWGGDGSQRRLDFFMNYEGVSQEEFTREGLNTSKPFKTGLGYPVANDPSNLDHISIYVGKDKGGAPWVLSKDGWGSSFEFRKGLDFESVGFGEPIQPSIIYKK